MVKDIKLDMTKQRDLTILIIVSSLVIIWLFNLFWEPIAFMLFMCYLVLNKNKALTKNELLIAGIVTIVLLYSCIARLFGCGPGLFVILVPSIVLFFIYFLNWRSTR